MKKTTAFISILLALTMLLSSCSVKIKGSGDEDVSSVESQETVKATEIELNTDYDFTDGISFNLVRAGKTPIILDTAGSGQGYEPYSSYAAYIDLIFDITNGSYTDFDCNESIKVDVEYDYGFSTSSDDEDDDTSATSGVFVGENDGWASMSTFSKAVVPAGETVRVHYFVSYANVKVLSPSYKFVFSCADSDSADSSAPVYEFSYNTSQGTLGNADEIKLKETFTIENYANITLEDVKFSTKLLPSSTWGSYSYYEVQEYGKTFLIFKFTVENLTEDVIVGKSAINGLILNSQNLFDDAYYISSSILEESNKKDLTQAGAIEAGKKNIIYAVFEVPTTFEEANNYEVTFTAGGSFYTYQSENYGTETSSDVDSDTSSY